MSPKLSKVLFALAAMGCALVIVKFLAASTKPEPLRSEVNKAQAAAQSSSSQQDRDNGNDAARSISSKSALSEKPTMPTSEAAKSVSSTKSVERWTLIKKENMLPLISFDSLRLTDAAAALMELQPEQARSVNLAIDRFLDRLRAEEIAHAYVSVDPNGNEQIVVRPFDRTKMIEAFRNELQTAAGTDVAQFLGNQATSNPTLAAGNLEMRAYVEHTPTGEDQEFFVRTLETPINTIDGRDLPPRIRMTSKLTLGTGTRIQHLFAAMNQLPRVVENPSLPKSARASNPAK